MATAIKKFHCTNCGSEVMTEVRPLRVGDDIWDSAQSVQGHKDGDACDCKECGAGFVMDMCNPENWW
jgi:hypothetical protein